MAKDLKLVHLDYNVVAAVFFVSRSLLRLWEYLELTNVPIDPLLPRRGTLVRVQHLSSGLSW